MAEAVLGPPLDSSTPLKLPEQLRDILETERRICQRLKDNYDLLKDKYSALHSEHASLRVQYDAVVQADTAQAQRRQAHMDDMATQFREKLALVERELSEQQLKFEQFKRSTKTEIAAVYQTKLDRSLDELDEVKKTTATLLVERARLLADLEATKAELNDERKMAETRYSDLKRRTDGERVELMARVNALSSKGHERLQSDLIESNERSSALLAEVQRLRAQNRDSETQNSTVVADLQRQLVTIGREKSLAASTVAQLENELDISKQRLSFNKEEIGRLQQELAVALNAKTTAETQHDRRIVERNVDFMSRANSLQASLAEAEKAVATKSAEFAELSAKLSEVQRVCTEEHEPALKMRTLTSPQVQHTELRKSSDDVEQLVDKQSSAKMEAKLADIEQQHALKMREVQWERDRLETQLTKLRQRLSSYSKKAGVNLESYASLEAELKNTKLELVSSQKKLTKMKEHYRDLLKKMKKSFRVIENKFATVKQELERKSLEEVSLKSGALINRMLHPEHHVFLETSDSPEVALIRREVNEYRREHERFAHLLRVGERRLLEAIQGPSVHGASHRSVSHRKKRSNPKAISSSTSNDLN